MEVGGDELGERLETGGFVVGNFGADYLVMFC